MAQLRRNLYSLGAGLAALSFGISVATGEADASSTGRAIGVRIQRGVAAATQAGRTRLFVTPTYCSTSYGYSGYYFVADPAGASVAGGEDSSVLAGAANQACNPDSAVGAGEDNVVGGGTGGEAAQSFIAGGYYNDIVSLDSFVGAGIKNEVAAASSFVGAGENGSATGVAAFVGAGGYEATTYAKITRSGSNVAGATDSFVGAGDFNQVSATGSGSFIGAGGFSHAIEATAPNNQTAAVDSFIGAGDLNTITSGAAEGVIAGGDGNSVGGQKGVIGGGEGNEVEGAFSVVPGGYHDQALGNESFAAGSQAEANDTGTFVWSDYASGEAPLKDKGTGTFVARASGGVYFYSNGAATSGVTLAAGSGTWSSLSDRNAKTDVVPLDDASILAKVATLPVSAWRYKTESGVRHVGPMAQDFYSAFGVGEDDRHITSIDEDGVALAAIKALNAKMERKDAEVDAVRLENGALRNEVSALVHELRRFEARRSTCSRVAVSYRVCIRKRAVP